MDLKSSDAIKAASLGATGNRVAIEGTIGTLEHAGFVENSVLEVAGARGVLRIDLSREDLGKHRLEPEESDAK